MGKNVIARQSGDDYQARFFWLKACGLNLPETYVKRVGWEVDSSWGFDDVVVYYEPSRKEGGENVEEDCFQVKFHVDHDKGFTWEALMDPEFIGGKKESLLQRLYKNYENDPEKFSKRRFYIVNTWGIDHHNDLKNLLGGNNGGVRLDILFNGGEKSKFGKIRKAWKDHLGIKDDSTLKKVLAPLRIKHSFGDTEQLKEALNVSLVAAGLLPILADQQSSKYGDLIQKLHSIGRNIFTREDLLEICKEEKLLSENVRQSDDVFAIGIRSFQKGAESLEHEVHSIVCFLHCFSSRFILDEYADMKYINDEIYKLANQAIILKKRVLIHLDTHLSIALLLGFHLNSKYGGLDISIIQKSISGRTHWKAEPEKISLYSGPFWEFESVEHDGQMDDVVLSISITHDIHADVDSHVQQYLPQINRSLHAIIKPKAGVTSIKDGSHAVAAIEELIAQTRSLKRTMSKNCRVHLFLAGPNALAFFLGQRIKPLGKITLYEFDFEQQQGGGYHPIINLP